MNKSIVLILLLLVPLSFLAQDDDKTPKYSNEFLNIGVGARALGMSNSVIASTDDVTSGYWNPTGLLNIDSDLQIGLMHSEYFAGIAKYDYGAIAKKIDKDLTALFGGFSTTVGSASTTMSASLIFQAVAKLRANAVPGDNLNAVIHPQVAFDLKSGLTRFVGQL